MCSVSLSHTTLLRLFLPNGFDEKYPRNSQIYWDVLNVSQSTLVVEPIQGGHAQVKVKFCLFPVFAVFSLYF